MEERRLREELEKKEKAIKDQIATRTRGRNAMERERQLQQEKKEIEEAIKQIERKKLVQAQETLIAHENAVKYREEKSLKIQSSQQSQFTSKMSGGISAEVSQFKSAMSHMDYANTHFHTAMVINHQGNNDSVFAEEIQKLKQGAFEKAKEEQAKKSIQKA